MSYLLDTCILIDLLRGQQVAEAGIASLSVRPSVCAVSVMELTAGARSQRAETQIDRLLNVYRWVGVDSAIFKTAGSYLRNYRAGHGLDIADALIAATAEHHGLKLVTLNVKHFPMFPKLKPAY